MREWLGAMVCDNVVDVDSAGTHYWLPKERAKALCGETATTTVVVSTFIPFFARNMDHIKHCCDKNGPSGI